MTGQVWVLVLPGLGVLVGVSGGWWGRVRWDGEPEPEWEAEAQDAAVEQPYFTACCDDVPAGYLHSHVHSTACVNAMCHGCVPRPADDGGELLPELPDWTDTDMAALHDDELPGPIPDVDSLEDPVGGMDEDCADGLHEYCLTDCCECGCHSAAPVDLPGPAVHALNGEQVRPAGEHHERLGTLADEKEAAHLLLWDLECADYEAWARGQFELAAVAMAGFDVIPIPHLVAA